MSNSVRPHRWQPTRLPCPWNSPGKNTGVGCHFLLQHMKVKSEREVAQLSTTLCDPMNCSLPGSSVHGIFQARALEWGVIAFSEKGKRAPFFTCPLSLCFPKVTVPCGLYPARTLPVFFTYSDVQQENSKTSAEDYFVFLL